jgi:ubiquinone biosynthesis monooxygenase Coq7
MINLSDQRTIARILKVNHAGEFGAIRIYRAQLLVARWRLSDLVPFLTETLSHEIAHCQSFLDAMPGRRTRPCGAMSLWGIGGLALGLFTALTGRNAVMACTKAVEQTVHRHLEEQTRFLAGKDEGLKALITTIQIEEKAHLSYAIAHLRPSAFNAPLEAVIIFSTEIVIWLSTQGAVSRMEKAIRRN